MPKRKESCLDWKLHKAEIRDHYLVQDLSLEGLMRYMEETHTFRATKAQYETQLRKWDFRKNLTNKEWDYTLLRVRKRKFDGKESDVYFNGSKVPEKKIKKQMSRHFTLTQEQLFEQTPIPSTPEAITVATPKATADCLGSLPNPSLLALPELTAPIADLGMDHSPDNLLAQQDHPLPAVSQYREDWNNSDRNTWHLQAGAEIQAVWETNSVPTARGGTIIYNLPCFQFQALLESTGLFQFSQVQSPVIGTSQRRAPYSQTVYLPSFTSKDTHEWSGLALLQRLASRSLTTSNEEGQTLLAKLLGPMMKADSHEFLSQIQSQMRISSLERHDGETAEKFQSLLAPSNQSSLIQILHFALSHLSNNLLSEYATDDFLRWLIKQQQNELLVSFLKIQMPTVHACATKIFESALRIGDVDFLHLLISSGIDTSPLKGVYGSRHLICAARRGDLQIAQILLNNGADVNTPTSETYPLTALQMAAREGRDHMIQFLLEAGADINAVTMFSAYNTALSWAVFKDNTNIVRILLIEGANINICRLNGFPAIHFSARNCSNELDQLLSSECGENHLSIACKGVLKAAKGGIQALLKHLAERGEEARPPVMEVLEYALGRAVENMDHQAILSLLGIGVDPDTEMTPWLGWSRRLLQTAVESDDIESVKILVHAGADLNIPDILEAAVIAGTEMLRVMLEVGVNTETLEGALQYAADSSDLEAAEFILSYGINVNCLPGTYAPLTVLQCAVFSNNIKLVRILLDAGSDVNASIDQEGEQTALQIAVINTREVYVDLEVVQILLVAGADVNGPKSARTGASILESAIRIGNEELVQILLKEGADINSRPKGEEGRSPIQKAAERGNLYLVKLLLESGADINASAGHNRGATAIQGASFAKNPTVELIDFLLDSGADIHAPAGRDGGITALQAAAIRGHMKIALQFLEAGADVNAAAAKYNGRTALDGAAEYGRLDMVQLLLNAGACGDSTKAHRFDRAIELAQTNGHFAIAKLLEQA